jgi:imidazolonepropionase-like amidohydrolase
VKLSNLLGRVLAASFLTLLAPAPVLAFVLQDEGGAEEEGEEGEEEEEDDGTNVLAVVGGDVYTGNGEVLRGATILARKGRIREIGHDVYVPEDAEVLRVDGLRVYPGLVAISSSGLVGGNSDFEDTYDPFNAGLVLGLASDITSTGAGSSAVKLKRFDIENVVLAEKTYVNMRWDGRDPSSKRSLREKLDKASDYVRKYREWEEKVKEDKELKEPSKRGIDSSVLAVLRGETTARFKADDRADLLGIARLAQSYGFRPVIEGCREGWTVADELGRAGASAILTPRERRPKDERLVREGGSSIENAAILHRSGVQVAVVPARTSIDLGGIVGRDIMHLPIEADFAVRGGLPEEAAFEAITIVPARMLGVSHRVGSIAVGKDCDLIVTDGDILHYRTFVQYAVVDGKVVYDKEDELFFAHIRPRPPQEPEPDAGEEPVADEEEDEAASDEDDDEEQGDDDDEDEDEDEDEDD